MPCKTKSCQSSIGLKLDNGDISFDPVTLANKFNDFFCNIADMLLQKLPKRVFDVNNIVNFYSTKGVNKDSFKLCNVTVNDV